MADITLPDGSKANIPDFALDKTQKMMVDQLKKMDSSNAALQKKFEEFITLTTDGIKSGKTQTQAVTDALQDVQEEIKDQTKSNQSFRKVFSDRLESDVTKMFVGTGNVLTTLAQAATVAAAAIGGFLYKSFMDVGESTGALAKSGLAFTEFNGSVKQNITNLTDLGMSVTDAAGFLTKFSNVAVLVNTRKFTQTINSLASLSANSAELGLTMSESAEYLATELELRQMSAAKQLVLDEQERMSIQASLKATQQYTRLMGKSIEEIQNDKKNFIDNNARLSILQLRALSLPEAAQKNLKDRIDQLSLGIGSLDGPLQTVVGVLSSAAVSDYPLMDPEFLDLQRQLPAAAQQLRESMLNIRKVMLDPNATRADVERVQKATLESLAELSKNRNLLAQAGTQTAQSANNILLQALAMANKIKDNAKTLGDVPKEIDPLVTSSKKVQKALDTLSGMITNVKFSILEGLLPYFSAFGDALVKNYPILDEQGNVIGKTTSIMDALKGAVMTVFEAFKGLFPTIGDVTASADDMGKNMQNTLVPIIKDLGIEIAKYIGQFKDEKGKFIGFSESFKKIITDFTLIALEGMWAAIKLAWEKVEWTTILAGVGILFGIAVTKSLLAAGVTALVKAAFTGTLATVATSVATSIASAGTVVAGALTAAAAKINAMSLGGLPIGKGIMGALRFAPAILGGGMMAKDAYDLASGKDEANKGANWGGIIGGVVGGLGGAALTAYTGGLGAPAAVAMVGGGVALGNQIGEWVGSWWDSPEGEQTQADVSAQMREQLAAQMSDPTQAGLALMAVDDKHVERVKSVIQQLSMIQLTGFAQGLTATQAAAETFMEKMDNIDIDVINDVSKAIKSLGLAIKLFNEGAARIPDSVKLVDKAVKQLAELPGDKLLVLANAINQMTGALKAFSDLTSQNVFERIANAFSKDTTQDFIDKVNLFATEIKSDQLLKAAHAVIAMNAAHLGAVAVPEVSRTEITNPNAPAVVDNKKGVNVVEHGLRRTPAEILEGVERNAQETVRLLNAIKTNTNKTAKKDQ